MTNIIKFQDTELTIVDHNGERWLTGTQIGYALGYANPRQKIHNLFHQHKAEFNGDTTCVKKILTDGVTRQVRLFNRRGAHLLAMFARTKNAITFRKWVLDVLEEKAKTPKVSDSTPLPLQQQLPLTTHPKLPKEMLEAYDMAYARFDHLQMLVKQRAASNPYWTQIIAEAIKGVEQAIGETGKYIYRLS